MAEVKGKVGAFELNWKKIPRGSSGMAHLEIGGEQLDVAWRVDEGGIWIELPDGVHGFDIQARLDDEGQAVYDLQDRVGDREWAGQVFRRAGEEFLAAAAGARKKTAKVKAQMPGKIIKICVDEGAKVQKGDPIIVMEAMKMENEITAPQDGVVKTVKVQTGQAVESGAELLVIDSGEA